MNASYHDIPYDVNGLGEIDRNRSPILLLQHQDKLTSSCVSSDVAAERGYVSIDDLASLHQAGFSHNIGCPVLLIPLYDYQGKQLLMCRPDQPRTNDKGKPIKYDRPFEQRNIADVPPRVRPILGDPRVPLWITEAPLKADALVSQGVHAIDFVGCWGYRTKNVKGGKTVCPDLAHIPFNERDVYIVFDSDAANNPHVKAAEKQLAIYLEGRNANVYIVRLPHRVDGSKAGVDDYFFDGGTLDKLLKVHTTRFQIRSVKVDATDAVELWRADCGEDWVYLEEAQSWYRWNAKSWAIAGEADLDSDALHYLQEVGMVVTTSTLNAFARIARTKATRLSSRTAGLVNFQNGTLDPATGQLRAHCRADWLTSCLPYDYTPGHPHTLIDTKLAEIIPDPVGRAALAAHAGLAMMGDTRLHYSIYLLGPTRSGKSLVLKLMNALCSDNDPAACAGPSLFSSELEGKRSRAIWNVNPIVCVDEVKSDTLRNEETFKLMAAHGGVEMRKIGRDERASNRWIPKLVLSANDRPRYTDDSSSVTERIVFVECPNRRPEGQRDTMLFEKLVPELPAFASTCILSALNTLAQGYYPQSAKMRADRARIEHEGNPMKMFIREYCIADPTAKIANTALYRAYVSYCSTNGYKGVKSNIAFSHDIRRAHPHTESRTGVYDSVIQQTGRGLVGLRLREADDPDYEDSYTSNTLTGVATSVTTSVTMSMPQRNALEPAYSYTSDTSNSFLSEEKHTLVEPDIYKQEKSAASVTSVTTAKEYRNTMPSNSSDACSDTCSDTCRAACSVTTSRYDAAGMIDRLRAREQVQ